MAQPSSAQAAIAESSAFGLDRGEKLVVLTGGVMASLAITAISAVLPTIDRELAHSATDSMLVKQLVAGVTLAMVVGAPLGGFLIGRIGMRSVLLVATLIYTIAGTAGFYLASLPALLASRLLLGAAAATIQVTSIVLINTRLSGNDRARWMGIHIALATLSALIINPLSGFLGSYDWRWPFLEYLIGAVLFVALLTVKDRAAPEVAVPVAGTTPVRGPSMLHWFPWHYLFLSLMVGAVTFIPTIYMPFLLRDEAGLSPGGIAAYLTLAGTVGGGVALMYGRARRVISVHGAFVFSFSLAGIGALVVGLATALPLLIAGGMVYSVGIAWLVANMMTSLGSKVGPAQQGRAAGLVKAVHFSSAPISVIMIEPFARTYGPHMVMLVAASLSFLVVVLMLVRIARPARTIAPARA